jgi:predicted DsbA family dithiol-disulfide isomerase
MQVEIWSDIACPWCYVGKRRFESALAGFEHRDEVAVLFRSFELDPTAPAERGGEHAQHLADKYGMSLEQARSMHAQMTEVAAADGLELHFERVRGGNTFDGHRLLHLAAAQGRQLEMKERLMAAYFSDGELVSDREALVRLADEVGVTGAAEMLASEELTTEVRDDERMAARLGIRAVPCFVFGREFGISGAQPPEVLLDGLQRAWEAQRAAA